MKKRHVITLGLIIFALAAGCATQSRLQEKVTNELETSYETTEQVSSNALLDALAEYSSSYTGKTTLALGLQDALSLANRLNRTLQGRRERLHRSAIALIAQRRDFGLQVSSHLEYLSQLTGDDDLPDTWNGQLSLSRILPTGAELSLSARSTRTEIITRSTNDTEAAYRSVAEVTLRQPLLAGAGYSISHERLIQEERDLVYAVRTFALQRQDFGIDVVRSYYSLLNQKSVLKNTRLNVDQSEFLQKRSEALFKVRMASSIDVLRSQQQALTAQNQLSNAEAEFDIGKKKFLITLGLPIELDVEITDATPGIQPLKLAEEDCIKSALARRLDLITVRDYLEDAKRKMHIARNALLPDLELFGTLSRSDEGDSPFSGEESEDEARAGIVLEIPLDKRSEGEAVYRARLDLAEAQRNVRESEDGIRVDIIENFSRLDSLNNTVTIQRKNQELAEKRARQAQLRFKSGEFSNRDVVDAENELLDARNALARALTDYEVQRYRLLRNMGHLDVSRHGNIVELKD